MDHQRYAGRRPRATDELASVCGRGRWQLVAGNARIIDAGLFEHRAVFQHSGSTAALTSRPRPRILDETGVPAWPVKRGTDAILQIAQEGIDSFHICLHRYFQKTAGGVASPAAQVT
jgi:hypothetical protein